VPPPTFVFLLPHIIYFTHRLSQSNVLKIKILRIINSFSSIFIYKKRDEKDREIKKREIKKKKEERKKK
jgi:hypothetical protein